MQHTRRLYIYDVLVVMHYCVMLLLSCVAVGIDIILLGLPVLRCGHFAWWHRACEAIGNSCRCEMNSAIACFIENICLLFKSMQILIWV